MLIYCESSSPGQSFLCLSPIALKMVITPLSISHSEATKTVSATIKISKKWILLSLTYRNQENARKAKFDAINSNGWAILLCFSPKFSHTHTHTWWNHTQRVINSVITNYKSCHYPKHLDIQALANSLNPDQTTPREWVVWSGFILLPFHRIVKWTISIFFRKSMEA